jgi:putative endonuclease
MGIAKSEEEPGQWLVYMVQCNDKSLYTGVTTDLDRRLKEHNEGTLGAKYTRARRPVSLAWFEQCDSRSSATIREAEIKKLDRNQKLELIGK